MIEIGKSGKNKISFNLESLIYSRLLIQSNSGGGKSYAIRRLLEESHGRIQQIVLDLEGEFSTLRQKYDYIIAGKDGDTPADPRSAKLLARKLLELEVSAICDLSELKAHDRIRFVRYFLESIMSVPRSLWHPVLIIVDEAHHFCPEKGQVESHQAIIDLATRGRKRGFCAVLATQRIAKLHKDACAELLNKAIGRTSLDIDQKRASDELGLINKRDKISLRNLKPGEFHIYGPALRRGSVVENGVILTKVGKVKSHHPSGGAGKLIAPPKPTLRIKKILGKLIDLPAEAEKEIKDLTNLRIENANLKRQITIVEKGQPQPKPCNHGAVIKELQDKHEKYRIIFGNTLGVLDKSAETLSQLKDNIGEMTSTLKQSMGDIKSCVLPKAVNQITSNTANQKSQFHNIKRSAESNLDGDKAITGGALRMLQVLASRHPMKTTRAQLATLAGLKKSSGTYSTYFSLLKSKELIDNSNGNISLTDVGFQFIGSSPSEVQTSENIREMWRSKFTGGALRMLDALLNIYPNSMSKEDLANEVGLTYGTGTWGTYLSGLKSNDLIEIDGNMLKANETLFL